MNLFDSTINTIGHALDYSAQRNNVISNNIANVDTPNYKSQDVSFHAHFNQALMEQLEAKRTRSKHLPFSSQSPSYKVTTNDATMYSHNGNNVDIDKEMSHLAKNQIYYRGMIDQLNGKFNNLQTVIRGGK